jgi:hypothetical protein
LLLIGVGRQYAENVVVLKIEEHSIPQVLQKLSEMLLPVL